MKLTDSNIENLCFKLCRDKNIFTKYGIKDLVSEEDFANNDVRKRELNKIYKIIDGIIKNEISDIDQIIIELYYFKKPKRTQKQLANFLQVNQSYISKVLSRINKKIKFYYYRKDIDEKYLKRILYFLNEDYVKTLFLYIYRLNQEKVAKEIGKKQPTVSVRLNKVNEFILKHLRSRSKQDIENKEALKKFYDFFRYMMDFNFYPSFCVRSKVKHIYEWNKNRNRSYKSIREPKT